MPIRIDIAQPMENRKVSNGSKNSFGFACSRRDNSKGNIIALSNTNRVYQLISIAINDTFISISVIVICFGIPKPHLRRFRLAAGFQPKMKKHDFSPKRSVLGNICQQLMVVPILENIKQTWNALPCRQIIEFRLELSSRSDWWPQRCPIMVNIMCIFRISYTVPTSVLLLIYCV